MLATGCKKTPTDSAKSANKDAQASVAASSSAGSDTGSALPAKALDLGFASHLPGTTEAYFSSIQLQQHMTALKETNYYKEVTAFMEDRVPAPSPGTAAKGPKKPQAKSVEELLGKDFFFALGKGGAKSLATFQRLSALYTEIVYSGIMSGSKPGTTLPNGAPNPTFAAIFKDPERVKRMVDVWANLDLPPLMFGIRSDKPEETLKELVPNEWLNSFRKKARISKVSTTLSGQFTLVEATGKDVLTEEFKKGWLSMLPPEASAVTPELDRLFAALQAKKFSFAYGTAGGYIIFAMGAERPDLQFLTNPTTSLAARPEFGVLNSLHGKKLLGVVFAEGAALQALQNPEPLQPILRGIMSGLTQSPVFAGMAKSLEPKVAALAPLERKIYGKELTTLVAGAYWDRGLHVEMDGGLSPKGLEAGKLLKFSSLLDDPKVVFATDFHGDPQAAGDIRAYAEALSDTLHLAGLELVKANLLGDQGAKISEWVELEVIPQIKAFYSASKDLYSKGVGDEHALVIDLGGTMPTLPGMDPKAPKTDAKMLRSAQVNDVLDRGQIGDNWNKIQASMTDLAKAVPWLAGQKLPEPDVSNKSGITCYFYPSPVESDDLTLAAAVSDKLFMVGTSRTLEEDIGGRMLRAAPGAVKSTGVWRVNWANIREILKTYSTVGGTSAPDAADYMKSANKWLAPLGTMQGRLWIEAGHVRNSFSVEAKDTKKFD